jgi:hypothetical protein
MKMPYLSISKVRRKNKLVVDYRTRKQSYELTEGGIIQAGIDLYNADKAYWLYSSTVDFPEECELDVRELVEKGWEKRNCEVEKPYRSMLAKVVSLCSKREFQLTLTMEERAAFKTFNKKVKNA